jgi:cellulose biosynthesis protein BcsQ
LTISTPGLLNITIVSERFADIPAQQRREHILDLLLESNVPTSPGFLSLYTMSEADALGLSRTPATQEGRVDNWSDLAQQAMNASGYSKARQGKRGIPRTVAFYSFKGGVGRTTALAHVAWILAMRGRKVVAVDLDVEAPALSFLLNLAPMPEHGIVDYFYERFYLPHGVEPGISIAEIFGEARIPDASGRLFVVPAGFLDLNYITKVDDLRASVITERGEDLWSIFFREITEQLQPDIILVDSPAGINEWSAFSLLRAADQAIVFLYPNEQNTRGIDLLLEALAGKISLQLVFSPVPFGDAGIERVREYWQDLQSRLDVVTDQTNSDGNEEIQEFEAQSTRAEPIIVHYLTELALALSYPVLPLLSNYMNIANVVDEDTTAISREQVLSDTDRRLKIIESPKFPAVNTADPASDQNFRNLFQRTTDFDQFLTRSSPTVSNSR